MLHTENDALARDLFLLVPYLATDTFADLTVDRKLKYIPVASMLTNLRTCLMDGWMDCK